MSEVYDAAREYLLSFEDITDDVLERQLGAWRTGKKRSLPSVYRSLLEQAVNRNMMPRVIGPLDDLADLLCRFNPRKVASAYPDGISFVKAVRASRLRRSSDLRNPRGLWAVFGRAVSSSAAFLSSFPNVNEFHRFVESFYTNEYSRSALPLLLAAELDGFGFALACSFLKENGYEGFVKPDVHVKKICWAAGITAETKDFKVFQDIIAHCDEFGIVPYEFDQALWLVGSGHFTKSKVRIQTSRKSFIGEYLG